MPRPKSDSDHSIRCPYCREPINGKDRYSVTSNTREPEYFHVQCLEEALSKGGPIG